MESVHVPRILAWRDASGTRAREQSNSFEHIDIGRGPMASHVYNTPDDRKMLRDEPQLAEPTPYIVTCALHRQPWVHVFVEPDRLVDDASLSRSSRAEVVHLWHDTSTNELYFRWTKGPKQVAWLRAKYRGKSELPEVIEFNSARYAKRPFKDCSNLEDFIYALLLPPYVQYPLNCPLIPRGNYWELQGDPADYDLISFGGLPPLIEGEHPASDMLRKALLEHNVGMVREAIALGANVHRLPDSGSSPLEDACSPGFPGRIDALKALLAAGANINDPDRPVLYDVLLFPPSEDATLEIVEDLLALGANPNQRARDGLTPLVRAVRFNLTKVVRRLLEAGADPRVEFPSESGYPSLGFNNALDFLRDEANRNPDRWKDLLDAFDFGFD